MNVSKHNNLSFILYSKVLESLNQVHNLVLPDIDFMLVILMLVGQAVFLNGKAIKIKKRE
jgi:hypothetical protein